MSVAFSVLVDHARSLSIWFVLMFVKSMYFLLIAKLLRKKGLSSQAFLQMGRRMDV